MKESREWAAALADKLDLPGELLPGAGSLTVSGGRRAHIEGHRGILAYSEEMVAVSFGRQRLTICGSGLRLEAMNGSELLITGRIRTAEWS